MYNENDLHSRELAWVTILSTKRHDLFNHLQVLKGLTKLGKYDQINQYLDAIITELKNEVHITYLNDPALIKHLLIWYYDLTVSKEFEINLSEKINWTNLALIRELEKLLSLLCIWQKEHGDIKFNLIIAKQNEKIDIVFIFQGKNIFENEMLYFEQILNSLQVLKEYSKLTFENAEQLKRLKLEFTLIP